MNPDLGALQISDPYKGTDDVTIGDGKGIAFKHVGHSTLFTNNDRAICLNHLLHVPHLRNNLLFVQKFTKDNHCSIQFDSHKFIVKDQITKLPLLQGSAEDGIYRLPGNALQSLKQKSVQAFMADKVSVADWHARLGHLNFLSVLSVIRKNNLPCVSPLKSPEPPCSSCCLGKLSQSSLPSTHSTSSGLLDLVLSDVWGPFPVVSFNRDVYFVIFIDGFSKFC